MEINWERSFQEETNQMCNTSQMCKKAAIWRRGPKTDVLILLFIPSAIFIVRKLKLLYFLFLQTALSNHQVN